VEVAAAVVAGEKALPQLGQNAAPATTLVPHFEQNDNAAITIRDRYEESSYAYRPRRRVGCMKNPSRPVFKSVRVFDGAAGRTRTSSRALGASTNGSLPEG